MDKEKEQRVRLRLCASNDISCSDAFKMPQKAFGDTTISKTKTYDWYKEIVDDLLRREEIQEKIQRRIQRLYHHWPIPSEWSYFQRYNKYLSQIKAKKKHLISLVLVDHMVFD